MLEKTYRMFSVKELENQKIFCEIMEVLQILEDLSFEVQSLQLHKSKQRKSKKVESGLKSNNYFKKQCMNDFVKEKNISA